MPCIMPEQPYCPCCRYGLMLHSFEDSDEFCEWVCTLSEKEYERIKNSMTIESCKNILTAKLWKETTNGENGPSI